jgi:hypothetical protein
MLERHNSKRRQITASKATGGDAPGSGSDAPAAAPSVLEANSQDEGGELDYRFDDQSVSAASGARRGGEDAFLHAAVAHTHAHAPLRADASGQLEPRGLSLLDSADLVPLLSDRRVPPRARMQPRERGPGARVTALSVARLRGSAAVTRCSRC